MSGELGGYVLIHTCNAVIQNTDAMLISVCAVIGSYYCVFSTTALFLSTCSTCVMRVVSLSICVASWICHCSSRYDTFYRIWVSQASGMVVS
jgi:hypothetical protein